MKKCTREKLVGRREERPVLVEYLEVETSWFAVGMRAKCVGPDAGGVSGRKMRWCVEMVHLLNDM